MRISEISQALYLSAIENPNSLRKISENLHYFMSRKGLKRKLPLILEKLDKITAEKNNILELNIETARPLSEKAKEQIRKKFHPKKVFIRESIREDLFSGIIIKANETTYNSSIKDNLDRLKEALWQIPIK